MPNSSPWDVGNRSKPWELQANWEPLPRPNGTRRSDACAARATFVTIVSGKALLPRLACLHRQLKLVRSRCPLLAVYDDNPQLDFGDREVGFLKRMLGAEHVLPASWLFAQAMFGATSPLSPVVPEILGRHSPAAANLSNPLGARQHGRRLLTSAHLFGSFMIKLYLWAMPLDRWSRMCYLDLDMLVQDNIDELLDPAVLPLSPASSAAIAAAPALGCKKGMINSGVLVLQPSVNTLRRMMYRTCMYFGKFERSRELSATLFAPGARDLSSNGQRWQCTAYKDARDGKLAPLTKACEYHLLDQSVLNWEFDGVARMLPFKYNWQQSLDARSKQYHLPVPLDAISVIHFIGNIKPWGEGGRKVKKGTSLPFRAQRRYLDFCRANRMLQVRH